LGFARCAGAKRLERDDELAAGAIRLHQLVRRLDLLEPEHLRWFRLVCAIGGAIDERLERNLGMVIYNPATAADADPIRSLIKSPTCAPV
jgi:hypothetical protein